MTIGCTSQGTATYLLTHSVDLSQYLNRWVVVLPAGGDMASKAGVDGLFISQGPSWRNG